MSNSDVVVDTLDCKDILNVTFYIIVYTRVKLCSVVDPITIFKPQHVCCIFNLNSCVSLCLMLCAECFAYELQIFWEPSQLAFVTLLEFRPRFLFNTLVIKLTMLCRARSLWTLSLSICFCFSSVDTLVWENDAI